jgi:hypothetical protein
MLRAGDGDATADRFGKRLDVDSGSAPNFKPQCVRELDEPDDDGTVTESQ